MAFMIILAVALLLFGLAFITKRRFGVLGLGLAAGVLLAQNATKFLVEILQINSVPVEPFTYSAAATIALTLLPALLLLIAGPSYMQKRSAIIGAVAFSLLGTLLILGPLTTGLPTLETGVKETLDAIARWQGTIIAVSILAAVFDTVLLHTTKSHPPKHGKH